MCVPLLRVELRDALFGQTTLSITIVVQLLANEGVPGLTAPIMVWERHLDAREILPMLQQDHVEEPNTIVKDVFILQVLLPRGPQMSTQVRGHFKSGFLTASVVSV